MLQKFYIDQAKFLTFKYPLTGSVNSKLSLDRKSIWDRESVGHRGCATLCKCVMQMLPTVKVRGGGGDRDFIEK